MSPLTSQHPLPALRRCSWIKGSRWSFIEDDSAHLVLYTTQEAKSPHPQPIPRPRFANPAEWHSIFHQTAGYACHHLHLFAKFLRPRPRVAPLLQELAKKYEGSLLVEPVRLSEASAYQGILSSYGLGADRDYHLLQEGFYPIDIEFLGKVTGEKFPADLQTLLVPPRRTRWSFLHYREFGLAILGPNCD